MCPILKQIKQHPFFLRDCLRSSGIFTAWHFSDECCWLQKQQWGCALARRVNAVAGGSLCRRWWGVVESVGLREARSLAPISCTISFSIVFRVHSSSPIFLPRVNRRSLGSLFMRTDEKRVPYESEATPKAFRPRTPISTVSWRQRSALTLFCEVTGSTFMRISMWRDIIRCLLLNRFCSISMAPS